MLVVPPNDIVTSVWALLGVNREPHGVTLGLMHPNGTGLTFLFPAGVDFGCPGRSPLWCKSLLLDVMSCPLAVGGSGSFQA